MAATSEAKVTRRIIAYLKRLQSDDRTLWWIKIHGGAMQKAGAPDLLILYRGHLLGVEIKRPGGSATLLQRHTMDEMEKAGAVCFVATCIADVQRELMRL